MTRPVVIVGLGPVGATLALLLVRRGVPVIGLERDAEVVPHARAIALDDEALAVLHDAGISEATGLELLHGNMVRLRGRSGRPLVDLPPFPTPSGLPSQAFFGQPQLERLLRARLAVEPLAQLCLGWEARAFGDEGDGVRVDVEQAGSRSATQTIRGSFLIGCDGARSTVRAGMGSRLTGRTAGAAWLVVDTKAPPAAPGLDAAAFEFSCDPRGPWVHGPLPGGTHRWEFMLGQGGEAARSDPSSLASALIARRLDGAPPPAVLRASVYTFHARVATRWRAGRVLLAGDAAHLAPPFAGQGLGAGLRDAGNLAWKLAAVLDGGADADLLDTYARERLPHVVRMTALAAALGAIVQTRRPRAALARDAALARAIRLGPVRRWVACGGYRPAASATKAQALNTTTPRAHPAITSVR